MGSYYLHRKPLLNMFRGGFLLLEAALNLVLARIVAKIRLRPALNSILCPIVAKIRPDVCVL